VFLAARTHRLELGVSALVVPQRNPLVALMTPKWRDGTNARYPALARLGERDAGKTAGQRACHAAALSTEHADLQRSKSRATGLEPATSGVTSRCYFLCGDQESERPRCGWEWAVSRC
jgi:hypothetical protein